MIGLYDHIQELRAELRGCGFTRRERAAVQAVGARRRRASRDQSRPRPRSRGTAACAGDQGRVSGPLLDRLLDLLGRCAPATLEYVLQRMIVPQLVEFELEAL
jgi:hypothetical protein